MRSGRLRHQITLQSPVTGQNSVGEKIQTFADVGVVWAGVEDATTKAAASDYSSDQVYHHADKLIIIRHRHDIREGWRILHQGRALSVLHLDDRDGRNAVLHLRCVWTKELTV